MDVNKMMVEAEAALNGLANDKSKQDRSYLTTLDDVGK
jgi:hypothetical protein